MEPNKNKDLDRFLRKAMKASKIEQAPPNFTENVMSKIEAIETKKISHGPIISNKKWIMIAGCVLALIGVAYVVEIEIQSTYLNSIRELIKVDFSVFNISSGFNIPEVLMYAILLFGLCFGIQIALIKYYYSILNPAPDTESQE